MTPGFPWWITATAAAIVFLILRMGLDFESKRTSVWRSPKPYVEAMAFGTLIVGLGGMTGVVLALDGLGSKFVSAPLRPSSTYGPTAVMNAHLHPWLALLSSVFFLLASRRWREVLWTLRMKRFRARQGRCGACGYPSEGIESMVCPECGRSFFEPVGEGPEMESLLVRVPLMWFALALVTVAATIVTGRV